MARSMVSGSRDGVVYSDAPWPGALSSFQRSTCYDGLQKVSVDVEGRCEEASRAFKSLFSQLGAIKVP